MSFLNPSTEVIPTLATVLECDSVLQQIDKELEDLNYESVVIARRNSRAVDTSGQLQADLSSAEAVKTAYETSIVGLPVDSPVRKTFEDELVKTNYKIFSIQNRLERQGKGALIEFSLENDAIQSKITALTAVRADVETHKATL